LTQYPSFKKRVVGQLFLPYICIFSIISSEMMERSFNEMF